VGDAARHASPETNPWRDTLAESRVDPDEEFMNSSGGRARSGAYDEVVRTVFWVLLLMIAVLASASFLRLRSPDSATAAPTKTPIAGAPVGTVREIMKTLVDPNAEIVWGAVGVIHEKSGTVEKEPRTEDEWTTVENGAMTLAEVATLLKTPGRHIARPEEAGTSRWPQATLTPVQIEQEVLTQSFVGPEIMRFEFFTQSRQVVRIHDAFERRCAMSHASVSAARKLSARATPLPAMSKPVP